MGRKCPPGTICIENITIIFLIVIIFFAVYLFNKIKDNKVIVMQQRPIVQNIPQNNFPQNVFLDPHVMPVRETRAYTKDMTDPRGLPINIRTQGVDAQFRQVGILTRNNGGETILPLMGRPLQTNRDKHQFYTMNDKNHMIKLPISKNGRSCTGEYGCDDLFNGDTVYVEGYKDSFKVTMYESNVPRYIPFV
tara:strand:- start:1413 stop:1988 length:576 start_codon:yes stop_codon:yes gene_type:complete